MELHVFFSFCYNLSFVLGETCVSLGQVRGGLPPANVEAMLAVAVPGAQRVIVRQVRRQRSLSRVGGLVGCLPPGDIGFDAAAISRRLATAAPAQLDGACPAKTAVGRVPPRPKCSRYDPSAVAVAAVIGRIRRWRRRVFTSGDTHAKIETKCDTPCVWVPWLDFVNRNEKHEKQQHSSSCSSIAAAPMPRTQYCLWKYLLEACIALSTAACEATSLPQRLRLYFCTLPSCVLASPVTRRGSHVVEVQRKHNFFI